MPEPEGTTGAIEVSFDIGPDFAVFKGSSYIHKKPCFLSMKMRAFTFGSISRDFRNIKKVRRIDGIKVMNDVKFDVSTDFEA